MADLEKLCGRPHVGTLDVGQDAAAILAAAWIGTVVGHVAMPALAIVYIGVRQRHLSNLAHECVHSKLLATRRGNRVVGYLLTGLLGEGFRPYRSTHNVHHVRLGSAGDPMLQSYQAGNLHAAGPDPSRARFVVQVIARNAIWRLPKSAVLTLVTKAPQESWLALGARGVIWTCTVGVCWRVGLLGELLLYWLVPLVIVRPVITWITDLGNHAGLIENTDPWRGRPRDHVLPAAWV